MIKALLTKIESVFSTEFLFGFFLPSLIFFAAVVATVAGVLGFEASITWMAARETVDKIFYPFVAGVTVIVFAYALSGLRPLVVRFWSGEVFPFGDWPAGNVMKAIQRKEFMEKRAAAHEPNRWKDMASWLQKEALAVWGASQTPAQPKDICRISDGLAGIDRHQDRDAVEQVVRKEFIGQLKRFAGDSLSPIYKELKQRFTDWAALEQQRLGVLEADLNRSYSEVQYVRATRLGNLIESYRAYSHSRYAIEPDVFWAHLHAQFDEKFAKDFATAETMLDFALNIATLGTLYAMLVTFGGPWLDPSFGWIFPVLAGLAVAGAGYSVSLVSAEHLGDLFRAAYDLYRLKVLRVLRSEPAKLTLYDERKMWEELSQLVVRGSSKNFDLPAAKTLAAGDLTT